MIPFQQFYYRITEGPYNIVTDVYALMFLCDAIGFIIVSFSYKNFAPVVSLLMSQDTCDVLEIIATSFIVDYLQYFIAIMIYQSNS